MSGSSSTCEKCGGRIFPGGCRLCPMFAAAAGPSGQTPECWPMLSDGLAVHVDQIPAAMARNKRHGVTGVTYNPVDGRAILADRGARKALMRLEGDPERGGNPDLKGCHDRQGGFGDG